MNPRASEKHSMDSLFMILLFGLFVLFLLLMLLFSAQAYHSAANGFAENYELRTAMSYLTTKLHQNDSEDCVFSGEVDGAPALCLKETISEKDYITYIYLDQGMLKELFTSSQTVPVKEMGTAFCELQSFEIQTLPDALLCISLVDTYGHTGTLYLHPGITKGGAA